MAQEAQIPALGFLTVVEDAEHGLFGGYLVLNLIGRPLEFHCTTPVKANRAQQILYGPTLAPYLYGEQIAQTLIRKGAVKPRAVFTDQAAVLAARQHVDVPLVLAVDDMASQSTGDTTRRIDPPQTALKRFGWGRQPLAVDLTSAADEQLVLDRLSDVAEDFDLLEPFGRIREAIAEASRN